MLTTLEQVVSKCNLNATNKNWFVLNKNIHNIEEDFILHGSDSFNENSNILKKMLKKTSYVPLMVHLKLKS